MRDQRYLYPCTNMALIAGPGLVDLVIDTTPSAEMTSKAMEKWK